MKFRIGQKVVCVNDDYDPLLFRHADWPTKGQAYTVAAVTRSCGTSSHIGLRLVEIKNAGWNQDVGCLVGYGFSARRFRPATDIAVFEKMLKRTPEHQDKKVS
jgi:hypothetical protein